MIVVASGAGIVGTHGHGAHRATATVGATIIVVGIAIIVLFKLRITKVDQLVAHDAITAGRFLAK